MTDAAMQSLLREIRDLLIGVRPYVAGATTPRGSHVSTSANIVAEMLLERIDGAIAEADEVLS